MEKKQSLKAAGKKRLDEFRAKRQLKSEGSASSRAQSDLPEENEAGESGAASSREVENQQNQQPAENASSAVEVQPSTENDALQQVDENVCTEREARLRELETKLSSAELDAEQKVAMIESLSSSLQRCREECGNAEEERENAVAALELLSASLQTGELVDPGVAATDRVASASLRIEQASRRKDEELEHLQKVVEDLKAGEELANEEITALRSELSISEQRAQEASTQLELGKQKLSSQDEELGRLKAELARHVTMLGDLEKHAAGLGALRTEQQVGLEKALRSVSELESEVSLRDEELQRLEKLVDELDGEKTNASGTISGLRSELEKLEKRELDRALEMEALREEQKLKLEEAFRSISVLECEKTLLVSKAEESERTVLSQGQEIERLREELSRQVSALEEFEKRDSERENELRKAGEELASLRSELASTEEQARGALAEAELGNQQVLRLGEEVSSLNEKLAARVLELEVAEKKSYQELEALRCELEKVSELEAEKTRLEKELEMVTGDYQTLRDQGSARGGDEKLEFERNLREVQLALEASKRSKLESLEGFVKMLDKLSSSAELLAGEEDARLGKLEAHLEALENEAMKLNSHAASLFARAAAEEALARRVSELENKLAKGDLERENTAATIAQQDAWISDLQNDVLQANSRREQLALELERLKELEQERGTRIGTLELELREAQGALEEANECMRKIGGIVAGVCRAPEVDLAGKVEHLAREFLALVEKSSTSEKETEEKLEKANAELIAEKQAKDEAIAELRKNDVGFKTRVDLITSSLLELLPVNDFDFSGETDVVRRLGLIVEAVAGSYREASQQASSIKAQLLSFEEDQLKLRDEDSRRLKLVQDDLARKASELEIVQGNRETELEKVAKLEAQLNLLQRDLAGKTSELEIVQGSREVELEKTGVLAGEVAKLETQLASAIARGDACKKELDAVASQRDQLLESEQRLSGVREKLGLAIKKGKGLAQQRDELRDELARKSTELEELSRARLEESSRASAQLESVLRQKQEELEKLKQEWSSREQVLKRRSAELLDESRREAWKQVQQAVDQLESARAELRDKSEAEARLRSSLEDKVKLEREVIDSLEAELSRSYDEKMGALSEVEKVAKNLMRLLCSRDYLQAEPKPSPWTFTKAMASSPSESLHSIKERENLVASHILESSSSTRGLLEEMIAAVQQQCGNAGLQSLVSKLESNEREFRACKEDLAAKQRELESLLPEIEEKERLAVRVEELESLLDRNDSAMGNLELARNKAVGKLTFTLGKFTELQQQCEAMLAEIESLQTNLDNRHGEITGLNQKVAALQGALDERNESFSRLEARLKALVAAAAGGGVEGDSIEVLEAELQRLQHENEKLGLAAQRNDTEVQNLRAQVEKLTAGKIRGESEIVEVEQEQQKHIAVASAPHFRSQKKTPPAGDHHQVAIDIEAQHLSVEEKGNVFKSLGMIRYFPKAGHRVGEKIDALSMAAGRVLMRQPVTRLSLILYWIAIHVWILATVSVAKL